MGMAGIFALVARRAVLVVGAPSAGAISSVCQVCNESIKNRAGAGRSGPVPAGSLPTVLPVSITVAPPILEVVIAGRSSLDQRFVPFRGPNSHRTRTEHVQNEEYFSVRREPATVMLENVGLKIYKIRAEYLVARCGAFASRLIRMR